MPAHSKDWNIKLVNNIGQASEHKRGPGHVDVYASRFLLLEQQTQTLYSCLLISQTQTHTTSAQAPMTKQYRLSQKPPNILSQVNIALPLMEAL